MGLSHNNTVYFPPLKIFLAFSWLFRIYVVGLGGRSKSVIMRLFSQFAAHGVILPLILFRLVPPLFRLSFDSSFHQ